MNSLHYLGANIRLCSSQERLCFLIIESQVLSYVAFITFQLLIPYLIFRGETRPLDKSLHTALDLSFLILSSIVCKKFTAGNSFKMSKSALIASQISCMFLLLLGTLLFGVLPVFVKNLLFKCECVGETCKKSCRARKGKLVTSFLIYFGGGVLLGTCLLHLLPESREGFEDDHDEHTDDAFYATENETLVANKTVHEKHEHHEQFPLPEFIVCCGFFAVYLFEEIVHFFLGGHSHVPTENRAIRSFSRSGSCVGGPRLSNASHMTSSGEFKPQRPVSLTTASVELTETPKFTDKFSIAGLLTVAALSFHSLFEGFAVGLRPDAVSTWVVFSAIAVHKYVIAFVVGLEVLAGGGKNLQVYIYMTVFALMSPLGMAIAMITQSNVEDSSPLTVSVLNAIATGTLLYVTFFEILQREEHKDIPTWIQLIATSTGFALMCVMQLASTYA